MLKINTKFYDGIMFIRLDGILSKKEVYICNCCGQMIASVDECDRAAFLDVSKAWGYFSKWDGCIHRFQLCENCYGKMIQTWCYLPDEEEQTEWI